MVHKIQVAIIILLIPFLGLYWYADKNDIPLRDFLRFGSQTVRVGDIPINVEIADTPAARERGLSGRKEMNVQGLLFVFDESGYHKIWMKAMHFPIDIIWISEDLKVIGITEDVRPDSYPKTFEPPKPARYVIETDIHFADTFGIKVGDKVRLPHGY